MAGGRLEVALEPLAAPASYGLERGRVARRERTPSSRWVRWRASRRAASCRASRSRSRWSASEVGQVPTLVFDEVDSGIGGAVAATVGRLLQTLGARRQVLCVTHLPQVAAMRRRALSRDQDRQRRRA